MSHSDEIVIDASTQAADAQGISAGDLFQWLPVIAKMVAAIEAFLAGGSAEIPAINLRIFGKRLVLGPIPLRVAA